MKPKKYYYMDRDGSMRYREVERPRRRRRRGVKSPAKLGAALAVLIALGAILAALVLGAGEAPDPQESAPVTPRPTAAQENGVKAADIGQALWKDFVEGREVPEDEIIATPIPVMPVDQPFPTATPSPTPELIEEAPLRE